MRGGGRHLFGYESLLNKQEKKWSLGVEIPGIGEEVIHLNFKNRVHAKGNFYYRLMKGVKGRSNRKLLSLFVMEWAKFIRSLSSKNFSEIKARRVGGHFIVERNLSAKNISFEIDLFDRGDKFFQRMILSLKEKKEGGEVLTPVKLHFFTDECDRV
jgi:hypothetical protein